MALKDLFSFFSSESTEKYHTKPHDPVKARKPLLAGINRARDDFTDDQYKKPNRWFSVKNEVVAFHPKLNGRTLTINGVNENHMPSDRFVEFLDLMEKEVEAGEFDEVIADHGKGNTDVHIGKTPRKSSPSTTADKPWTARKGWNEMSGNDQKAIAGRYRFGKNPDWTLISDVGHKPDAPFDQSRKKA